MATPKALARLDQIHDASLKPMTLEIEAMWAKKTRDDHYGPHACERVTGALVFSPSVDIHDLLPAGF